MTVYSTAASGTRRYRFAAKDITSLEEWEGEFSWMCYETTGRTLMGTAAAQTMETESSATCMLQEPTPGDCH